MDQNEVRDIFQQLLKESQYNVAKIPSHTHQGIDSNRITFRDLLSTLFCVATTTNGTAPVFVFTANNSPINATITGIFLVSKDTTAGNITIYNSGKTVATLVKGTTAGAMIGATSLANSTSASLVTVASDSAGNSTVFMTFST